MTTIPQLDVPYLSGGRITLQTAIPSNPKLVLITWQLEDCADDIFEKHNTALRDTEKIEQIFEQAKLMHEEISANQSGRWKEEQVEVSKKWLSNNVPVQQPSIRKVDEQ